MSALPPQPFKRVINLGGGVQSSTMLMMANRGLLAGGSQPDFAVFADTGNEPSSVYRMVDWLKNNSSIPVRIVRHKTSITESLTSRDDKSAYAFNIPWHTVSNSDGSKGMSKRTCTNRWKIQPIEKEIRWMLGLKRITKQSGIKVEQWIGISTDEIERVSVSRTYWSTLRHPLIEANMSRSDCHTWWAENIGDSAPPLARSACVVCPYHTAEEWIVLAETEPELFAEACEIENTFNRLQNEDGYDDVQRYLHRNRVPLAQAVEQDLEKQNTETPLFARAGECTGNCWT